MRLTHMAHTMDKKETPQERYHRKYKKSYILHMISDTPDKRVTPQSRYDATHTTHITLKLNLRTDADIIEYIGSQPSKQGAIKSAIRYLLQHRPRP